MDDVSSVSNRAPLLVALAAVTLLMGCDGGAALAGPSAASPLATSEVVAEAVGEPTPEAEMAARVNGEPVALEDYERQVARFERTLSQLDQGEGRQTDMAQVRRQVLDWMVDQLLIEQAAAAEGIAIPDEELDARVQEIVQQAGGEEAFGEWLAGGDMEMEGFQRQLRSELLGQKVRDRVLAELPSQAEQVHARHILVATRGEAEELLGQIRSGTDFAGLALERSLDSTSVGAGGDLGFFPRGIMPAAFEEAAFALAPGEVSDVVETAFGFHVIQALEKDPARQVPEAMLQTLREKAFVDRLQATREKAAIEVFVQ